MAEKNPGWRAGAEVEVENNSGDTPTSAAAQAQGGALDGALTASDPSPLREISNAILRCGEAVELRRLLRVARRDMLGQPEIAALLAAIGAALAAIDIDRLDAVREAIAERDAALIGGYRLQ